MGNSKAFHIDITKEALKGATLAIIPGDPKRVEKIAETLTQPEPLAFNREFCSYRAYIDNHPVVITSTGIGGASTSICVEELAQLGIKDFIRIGTTGAIQPAIEIGDAIITNASIRLDGASDHFAPLEYPAVANFDITRALVDSSQELGRRYHVGITASSSTFYPGQERYDTFTGRVMARFRGSMEEWKAMGALNYEMESATLLTMCSTMGLRAGCIAGVIVNRSKKEAVDEKVIAQTEEQVIRIATRAAQKLLKIT